MAANAKAPDADIAAVRQFNRFHTRLVGALNERILSTDYSLPQARMLYELSASDELAAADLAERLGLDKGYLSRLIAGLEQGGLVSKTADPANAKRRRLKLTRKGRAAFDRLDKASAREVAGLLEPLSAQGRRQLTGAMQRIERLLAGHKTSQTIILRPPEPGDLGWVAERHGTYYAQNYGWDWTFEALVCGILKEFAEKYDERNERCWMAEYDGERVGSVFIVRDDEATARLRMLFVDDAARGMGIGSRLVTECIRFARARNYKRIVLWTESVLLPARRLYEAAGFRIVMTRRHDSFGHQLTSETWMLEL